MPLNSYAVRRHSDHPLLRAAPSERSPNVQQLHTVRHLRIRQLLAVAVAASATVVSMLLLPELLNRPQGWSTVSWLRAPTYFHGLQAALWPTAIIGLFGLAILPVLVPRRMRDARLLLAVSRTALLVTILVSLVLLLSVALTPVL